MRTTTIIFWMTLLNLTNVQAQDFHTKIGQSFPSFNMLDLNLNYVSNSTLEGKPSLIVFFGTKCGPCLQELNDLNKRLPISFYKKFNIYLIGSTDDAPSLIEFNNKRNYKFKFIPDEHQFLFHKIADHTIPRTILLNRKGIIISQTTGFDETQLTNLMIQMKLLIE